MQTALEQLAVHLEGRYRIERELGAGALDWFGELRARVGALVR